MYQQKKKAHDAKKKQKVFVVKEVKFRPNIDEHDYDFKLRNAKRFLEEGDKVKATVQFRGREMARTELGARLLERVGRDIGEGGVLESHPELNGNRMHIIIGPPRHRQPHAEKSESESAAE
jgi:translation initiation factor IF-3